MTLPSTFLPLTRKIDGLLTDALGSGTRVLANDYFETDNFYPNKDEGILSKDALNGPQACSYISMFSKEDDGLNDLAGPISQYRIVVSIQLAYSLPPPNSKIGRNQVQTLMFSDMHKVRVVLGNISSNLNTDQDGNEIGLASGILVFDRITNVDFNYEEGKRLGIIEAEFWGIIELSNDF